MPQRPRTIALLLLAMLVMAPTGRAGAFGRPEPERNVGGIHMLARESLEEIDTHLTWARLLVGAGGYVTQPFTPVDRTTFGPSDQAVYFVEQAYARGLNPIVRLQGRFANGTGCDPTGWRGWLAPLADDPSATHRTYLEEAEGYRRFVAGLPRQAGYTLYVQVGNEPNLAENWGGQVNAAEYARFFKDVSDALRSLGDERIKVLNAGLAPAAEYDNLDFLRAAVAAEPAFATAFDYWASHSYPRNQPPEHNLHDGTALPGSRYTIDSYLLELDALRAAAPHISVPRVMLTESGYRLGDRQYAEFAEVTEELRAEYVERAFGQFWSRWPEVLAVTPFQLSDPHASWASFDWVWPTSTSDDHGFPTQPRLQYAAGLAGLGVVRGTVADSAGRPLKDVALATSQGGHRALSLGDGSFILIAFPGVYDLDARKTGHRPTVRHDVRVAADQVAELRLTLSEQLPTSLQNPSFELGELGHWTTWGSVDGPRGGPWYFGVGPVAGGQFLGTAVNCGEKDGGVFQSVAVSPGAAVSLSAWLLTFRVGDRPLGGRVGLDPSGGLDPRGEGIVWSPWLETAGGWQQAAVSTTAAADRVTVFLEHDQDLANAWNVSGFDGVELSVEAVHLGRADSARLSRGAALQVAKARSVGAVTGGERSDGNER